MKKIFVLICFFLGFSALYAQNAPFPYQVRIDTIMGDCFNNCGVIISILDQQGHIIEVNDSLHHPVDSIQYNLYQIQYHYKNQNLNSVFYSDNHVITMDAGTYNIGVSGLIRIQNGSSIQYLQVDTTINGINISSTYIPFDASILAIIASDNPTNGIHANQETSGNRNALSCGDLGRIQLKLQRGHFPYTVDLIMNNDTVRHVVFEDRQHHGNDSLYADFKDYYTFDSLPAGNYRIVVHDACSYTIVMHHTIELSMIHPNQLYFYQGNENLYDSNIVRFTVYFYNTHHIYNYHYSFTSGIFQYRFINPTINGDSDTTEWRPIQGEMINSMYNGRIYDTLGFAHRYCDLYNLPIIFQVRDLCANDTLSLTFIPKTLNPAYMDKRDYSICIPLSPLAQDTCASYHEEAIFRTSHYDINHTSYYVGFTNNNWSDMFFYTLPIYWVYKDSLTHQIIKIDTITSLTSISSLTFQDIVNTYGSFHELTIPVCRTLYDAHGCELYSCLDSLFFYNDTARAFAPSFWQTDSNFNRYNYSSCCYYDRMVGIHEENTPFPAYRDSTIIRLIQSPLYNKYNFTATYLHGEWIIVKDDSVNNDANIIADGMSIQLHHNCLSGGRYVFAVETMCGKDTLSLYIDGIYYYEWEWAEDAAYESYQECNNFYVTPVAGRYRRISYCVNPAISNDEPITDTAIYYPQINLVKGVVGGYSNTSVSMHGTFMFTIPGDYIIRMSYSACNQTFNRYDTIHFVRTRIDFDKAYAVVCDSVENIGSVIVHAINGSQPYHYSLYSEPDLHGNYMGSNTSGLFYNVGIHLGQELSINVTDSCENSYYVNIVAMSLSQSQLLWYEGGQPEPGVCEGDSIQLSALPFNEFINYSWHGPNNFSGNTQHVNFSVPNNCESGYIVVELLNTGCQYPVKDSVYLNVLTPPHVLLSGPDTICAGELISINATHEGNGSIFYDLYQSYLSTQSFQSISSTVHDSLSFDYLITADNLFWTENIHDNYCTYKRHSDTLRVFIRPVSDLTDSSHVIAPDQIICYNSDLQLSAQSDLAYPYIINWYDNIYQNQLLQQDTIESEQESSNFIIPGLTHDTTVYVMTYNSSVCPSRYDMITHWMNMCNGSSNITLGEAIRIYDSGGWGNNYQNNENLTHTFICNAANWMVIRFNSLDLIIGDSLYIYAGNSTNPSDLIAVYTDNTLPPQLMINSGIVTLCFKSNSINTNKGWNLDILTNITMTAVHADVIRYADTISIQTCQSDNPFDYGVINQIDVSQSGVQLIDTLLFSQMGCDSSLHVILQVLPKSYNTIDATICEGESIKIGSTTYNETGSYQNIIEANNGCDSVVTLNLQVIESSAEITSSNEDFCEQYMTILSFHSEGTYYQWNTGDETQEIIVTNPGTYIATATVEGCTVTGVYIIEKCDFIIYLPNTITPGNPDGLNDGFGILEQHQLLIQDFNIYIYSRWGELVFYSNDKNFKWYGEHNGYTYHNNMYSYVIFCTDREGQKHLLKGSVLVL